MISIKGAPTRGSVYKTVLTGLDSPAVITFPYNPQSYSVRTLPEWQPSGISGAESDGAKWGGNAPRIITFSELVDRAKLADGLINPFALSSLISSLEEGARQPTLITQEPTRWLLTMGVTTYNVIIAALDVEIVQTDPAGNARVARIQVEFWEQ